jgi:hypothetical protein
LAIHILMIHNTTMGHQLLHKNNSPPASIYSKQYMAEHEKSLYFSCFNFSLTCFFSNALATLPIHHRHKNVQSASGTFSCLPDTRQICIYSQARIQHAIYSGRQATGILMIMLRSRGISCSRMKSLIKKKKNPWNNNCRPVRLFSNNSSFTQHKAARIEMPATQYSGHFQSVKPPERFNRHQDGQVLFLFCPSAYCISQVVHVLPQPHQDGHWRQISHCQVSA